MNTLTIGTDIFKELFTPEEIQSRVKAIAREIEQDMAGETPILMGVMKGALIFLTDVLREIQAVDVEVDYVRLKSYGNNEVSSGTVEMVHAPSSVLAGRDVVIVEDIIDSGQTMNFLRPKILEAGAKSVRVATLLYKSEVARLNTPAEYIGFSIPNNFVIGYGLDYRQLKRNLRSIYYKV
jgi:hypoxanthine phosphoribosyltransferase